MRIRFSLLVLIISLYSFSPAFSQISDFVVVSDSDLDVSLSESSGIVMADGKLWTHTDSGGKAEIYAVDPNNGSIIQTIRLEGLINHDWEDLAVDDSCLYIADTGNNINGGRTDLAIYKINLNDIPSEGDTIIPNEKIEIIRFFYPEQGINPEPTGSNNTAFDCEAIVVMNDRVHLFTKDWTSVEAGYGTSEYILPNQAHPEGLKYPAQFLARHDYMGFLVTGADSWNSEYVLLIGYQIEAMGAVCLRLFGEFQDNNISTGKNDALVIGSALSLGQMEAVCFGNTPREGYVTNECFKYNEFTYPAKIKSFRFVIE